MAGFLIASYKVRLELFRSGNPVVTHRNRIIEIVSVMQFHGIVERAVLNFSTKFDNFNVPAMATYNASNPFAPLIAGWLPSTEFSFWYDILRNENPLTLFYDFSSILGASYIDKITLGTSTEPLGEGPADFSP